MKNILTAASFVSGKRNYILITNPENAYQLHEIEDALNRTNATYEKYVFCVEGLQSLVAFLKSQKLGSYFYVALDKIAISALMPHLKRIGLSDAEIQFVSQEEAERSVFCCRCHDIFSVHKSCGEEVACPACHLRLEVSNHFSATKSAYLGYVASSELKG